MSLLDNRKTLYQNKNDKRERKASVFFLKKG
uniref:Uncharacterized protein n=1 Tax=viral metagenome TaxID=1070528 RepID=A0A6C0K4E5_9ZZZZ